MLEYKDGSLDSRTRLPHPCKAVGFVGEPPILKLAIYLGEGGKESDFPRVNT